MISDEDLRKLHAEGWTDTDIGRESGYSRSCIGRRRRELGLPSNWLKYECWTPEEDERLLELKAQGKTLAEIGDIMGRGRKANISLRLRVLRERQTSFAALRERFAKRKDEPVDPRTKNRMRYEQWAATQRRNDNWQPGDPT